MKAYKNLILIIVLLLLLLGLSGGCNIFPDVNCENHSECEFVSKYARCLRAPHCLKVGANEMPCKEGWKGSCVPQWVYNRYHGEKAKEEPTAKEPKPEPQQEPKPEPSTEEPGSQDASEPTPDLTPEPQPEPGPEPRPEPQPEPKCGASSCSPGTTRPCYSASTGCPKGEGCKGGCKRGMEFCLRKGECGEWSGNCKDEVGPGAETCNGKDDDCDGAVDETLTRPCYTGDTGTKDKGLCKGGTETCKAGQWGTCTGQVLPAAETCDKKDNDCDGQVDEGGVCGDCTPNAKQACYTGPLATRKKGECKDGSQTCLSTRKWGPCQGDVKPVAESCNGKDDNCDGKIDGITKSCYTGPSGTVGKSPCKAGLQTCTASKWGSCVGQVLPGAELCDNKDNDCDGLVDEAHANKGKACSSGKGECLRTGTWVCNSQATGLRCTATAGTPKTETCNNKDDDCDGKIDGISKSCYTGPSWTVGRLPCKSGTQTCTAGSWGSCVGQVLPGTEVCNNQDDDCDGRIDNGLRPCFAWGRAIVSAGVDLVKGSATDSSGNVYITGYFSGTATFGTIRLSSAGSDDVFVAKLDTNGKWLWAKSAGGTGTDSGNELSVDSSGNVYIAGVIGGSATFGTINLSSAGSDDVFVAKLDTNGKWLWAKSAGGTGTDKSNSVAADSSGNVHITGHYNGTANFGSTKLTSAGSSDVFIAKLDTSGKWLWAKSAGGTAGESGEGISVDSSKNVYITGELGGAALFGSTNLSSAGSSDVFIAKLDSTGKWLWAKSAGGTSRDSGLGISVDSSGNVYATGYFGGTSYFGGSRFVSGGSNDVFVVKLDTNGNWKWAKSGGSADDDLGSGLSVDSSGNVYVAGSSKGAPSFGSIHLSGPKDLGDAFIAKLDTSGRWLWAKTTGFTKDGWGFSSSVDANGNIYTVGFFSGTASFNGSNLNSNSSTDGFITKILQ